MVIEAISLLSDYEVVWPKRRLLADKYGLDSPFENQFRNLQEVS